METLPEITPELITAKLHKLTQVFKGYRTALWLFPAQQRREKLFTDWSLHDVIAHLSAWNWVTIAALEDLQQGSPVLDWIRDEDTDAFNEMMVYVRHDWSWEDVLAEFELTMRDLLNVYCRCSLVQWTQKFVPADPKNAATPLSALDMDIDHMAEHLAEIEQISSQYYS